MGEWINEIWPYLTLTVMMILTGCGLPLPEEFFIIPAGVLAARGDLHPGWAFGALLVGALLGDLAMYGIGNRLGKHWLRQHRWFSQFFHAEQEERMEQILRRHGPKVFFLARFMIGVRGPLYIAAGVARVKLRYFVIVDAICATVVVGLFYGLSYLFGQQVEQWIRQGEVLFTVLVAVAVIIALLVYLKRRQRQGGQELQEICERVTPDGLTPADESTALSALGGHPEPVRNTPPKDGNEPPRDGNGQVVGESSGLANPLRQNAPAGGST